MHEDVLGAGKGTLQAAAAILPVLLLACSNAGGGAANPVGKGETRTTLAGANGGFVSAGGAALTIPPGALGPDVSITITATTMPPPAGARTWSPVYKFEPEGLTFVVAATIEIDVVGAGSNAAILWSKTGGGYEKLATQVTGGKAKASVTHFSDGVVADASVAFPGFSVAQTDGGGGGGEGICGVPCSPAGTCDGVFAGFACVQGECVSSTCVTSANCNSTPDFPQFCALSPGTRQCLTPCTSTVDCDQFQPKCFTGPTGHRYCTSADEVCVTDRDCGTGLRARGICDAPTGRCICTAASHCPAPTVCIRR